MAGRKAFIVKVVLDIQAVTCPGVWLCSNGQVSLQIYMLDSCVQTSSFRPSFPMLFHEKFVFCKTLPAKYHLEDLGKQLSREWLYVELIQWDNCESGNVLAYFQIPLNELLYPTVSGEISAGSEIDLLMEVTPAFPGTLAPKLEVSTKTTIDETICTCIKKKSNHCIKPSFPKTIVSCTGRSKGNKIMGYSSFDQHQRNTKCRPTCLMRCKVYEKPPWRYRKVEDGFLQRQPVLNLPLKPTPQLELDGGIDGGPYSGPRRPLDENSRSQSLPSIFERACNIFQNRTQPDRGMEIRRILTEGLRKALGQPAISNCETPGPICGCGFAHTDITCTVCQKYSGIFGSQTKDPHEKQVFHSTVNPDKSLYKQLMRQSNNNYGAYGNVCKAHTGPSCFKESYEFPETKEKLSKRLHERISKTLQSIPRYLDEMKEMCSDIRDNESSKYPCTCEQMPDMKKFYKELFHEGNGQ